MKLRPYIAATLISGLGLVGSAAIAATNNHNAHAGLDIATIVQGNSVLPKNGMVTVGTTGSSHAAPSNTKEAAYDTPANPIELTGGMFANLDAYYSSAHQHLAGVTDFNYNHSGINAADTNANKSFQDIYLRNANLFFGANAGIVHGIVNMGYDNVQSRGMFSSAGANNHGSFGFDEAYASLYSDHSANSYQLFAKAGRMQIDFGHYDVYDVLPTMTQFLTQAAGTGIEVGGVVQTGPADLFANITGFSGTNTGPLYAAATASDHRNTNNFSAKIGAMMETGFANIGLNLSYLHKVTDLSYFTNGTPGVSRSAFITFDPTNSTMYSSSSTAVKDKPLGAMDVDLNMQGNSGFLQDVSADFNFATFLGKAYAIGGSVGAVGGVGTPMAFSGRIHYALNDLQMGVIHGASLMLGGGFSNKAAGYTSDTATQGLGLPHAQFQLGLGAKIESNLSTQLVYQYSERPNAMAKSVKNSNLILLRLGVDV